MAAAVVGATLAVAASGSSKCAKGVKCETARRSDDADDDVVRAGGAVSGAVGE